MLILIIRSMHTKAFQNRFTWEKLRSFLHFKAGILVYVKPIDLHFLLITNHSADSVTNPWGCVSVTKEP